MLEQALWRTQNKRSCYVYGLKQLHCATERRQCLILEMYLVVIMVDEHANLLLRTPPDHNLYPVLGGSCLNLVVGQYGTH